MAPGSAATKNAKILAKSNGSGTAIGGGNSNTGTCNLKTKLEGITAASSQSGKM
ncbi:MAG: hypothetical protein LBH37_00085 [Oscillospiraceae bacterium]|nr:hypothetical protein [Oscillospiraceae bacterium]